ncbi:hypothetical protein CGRA01v4_06845 [Colletotrichum graminicola]|nr:hypothetical protein CGRA01v4_06845 [Colletotrichum graminicola]
MLLHRAPRCPPPPPAGVHLSQGCQSLPSTGQLPTLPSLPRLWALGSGLRVQSSGSVLSSPPCLLLPVAQCSSPFCPSLLAPCTCIRIPHQKDPHTPHPTPPPSFLLACAFRPPGPWPMAESPLAW